jgi:acyl-CoA synthetase (AMP-forming)/AMP-acid ligase II
MVFLPNVDSVTNPPFLTLVDLLRQRAQQQFNEIAYTFLPKGEIEINEIKITYGQLEQKAKAIAHRLQSLGCSGKRALLLYPSGLDFIVAFFGCLYAGVIAVPAYPPTKRVQTLSRLEVIANDSDSVIALTSRQAFKSLNDRWSDNAKLSSLEVLITDEIEENLAVNWQLPDITSNDLAFLQYTSGSTGTPKGVMVSHGNIIYNQQMIELGFQHDKTTVFVGWLPLFHDMGLIGNVLQPLYLGTSCVLMPPEAFLQKPIRWLKAISHYRATTSGGPNFAYDVCVNRISFEQKEILNFSSWRVAFNGSEPVRAESLQRFFEAFAECGFRLEAFYPCYGMAETTLFVSGGIPGLKPTLKYLQAKDLEQNRIAPLEQPQQDSRTLVSCGRTILEQDIIIVEPNSQKQCSSKEVGEIWVAGKNVTKGYWNKPKKTEQTFQAYLADTKEGPFLRTGDIGFIKDGELYVTGRLKDIIIVRGQNHYPQDIETTVQNSHPALLINSGAAFAVEIKNAERLIIVQEVVRSYVRKLSIKEIDINEIVISIKQAVTKEHELQVYSVILLKPGSLPKTSSGKIMRYACKRDFLNGNFDIVCDWSENPQGKVKFLQLQSEVDSMLKQFSNSETTLK